MSVWVVSEESDTYFCKDEGKEGVSLKEYKPISRMLDFWIFSWSLKEIALKFRIRKESSSCFQFVQTCELSMQGLDILTELFIMEREGGMFRVGAGVILMQSWWVLKRHIWLLTVLFYKWDFPHFLLSSLICAILGPGGSFRHHLKMAMSVAGAHRLFYSAHGYNTWVVGQMHARLWKHKDGRKLYLFNGVCCLSVFTCGCHQLLHSSILMISIVKTKHRHGWRWLVWSHFVILTFFCVPLYLQRILSFRLSLPWQVVVHPLSASLAHQGFCRYKKKK